MLKIPTTVEAHFIHKWVNVARSREFPCSSLQVHSTLPIPIPLSPNALTPGSPMHNGLAMAVCHRAEDLSHHHLDHGLTETCRFCQRHQTVRHPRKAPWPNIGNLGDMKDSNQKGNDGNKIQNLHNKHLLKLQAKAHSIILVGWWGALLKLLKPWYDLISLH